MNSVNLADVFAILKPDLTVATMPLSPTIYERLDTEFSGFKGHTLVSMYAFDNDWSTWEMHPKGDELVLLLSGSATLILRLNGSNNETRLHRCGEYVVVPRGAWHTAQTNEPTQMLFITPGEDTQNKPEL